MKEIVTFVEEQLKAQGSGAAPHELTATASTLVAEVSSELSAEIAAEVVAESARATAETRGTAAG